MMGKTVCLFVSLALLVSLVGCRGQTLEVVVDPDPTRGSDSDCLSAQELMNLTATGVPVPPPRPCETLNRALGDVPCDVCNNSRPIENVVVRLADGVHHLTACVGVVGSTNVTIEAENPGMAIIECSVFPDLESMSFVDIFFCESIGITFRGIQFQHCGPLSSNVFLRRTNDILFDDCLFTNNTGANLRFRDCSEIRILNTQFMDNHNGFPPSADSNDTSIEELYNSITTGGAFTFFSRSESTDILIQNCQFVDNSANMNEPNDSRPVLLKSNGHGGAILIRLAGVQDSEIAIEDSLFQNNFAEVDGGAIYFSLSESASSNTVRFVNNQFINNSVEIASGGAVSINSFNFSSNNTFLIDSNNFTGNKGNAGGAFSVALYDSNLESTQNPDKVNFTNCTFLGNEAFNEGTAVGLFSLVHVDQVGFPVTFSDCIFEDNLSLEETEDTSAIAAFRFPTIFTGGNYFRRNVGGGITLLNTRMQARGIMLFDTNTAVFGAGIAMDDRCLLEVSPPIEMTFVNNTARESGGGIYVEFPPIRFVVDIFNRLCFLQYSDGSGTDVPPQDWVNTTISFINNTARLSGAAIYASDMQQCGWLGPNTTEDSLIFDPPPGLDSPFVYSGNMLLPEGQNVSILNNTRLATAPSRIHYISDHSLVQPGETLPINLLATDQVNNSREAVWSLDAPGLAANLDALSANNDTYLYVIPSASTLTGSPSGGQQMGMMGGAIATNFSANFSISFSLLRTLGFISTLNLSVSGCHPGFSLDTMMGVCTCDTSNSNILRCDDNNRYLYLREGIWGGVRTNSDGTKSLITERVQPGYVSCRPQGRLPGCLFEFDAPDAQCRDGRRGRLCGTCEEGHGVTLDLQACTSISCVYGLMLFILLCVSVILVSLAIIYWDIELPNELKGFLFYAQVIGLVYRPYIVVQSSESAIDPLGIVVNLLGFSIPIPLCLSTNMKAHHVALLGYISPILAMLMVLAYAVAARFIRPVSNRSALKGITFLSLFVYKYIADSSFIFISCLDTDFGLVFQYDGSQNCDEWELGILFAIGLLLVVGFVAPAPFAVGYICWRRPQRFQQYADVLTNGLRRQFRWWGGWDIGRRLPFVFIGYFVVLARPSLVLFFMSLAALLVLIVHLFVKPFEEMYINVIEAAILLNLLMVTAAYLDPSNSPVPEWFSTLLVVLPYVYAAGYLIFLLARYIVKRLPKMPDSQPEDQSTQKAERSTTASTDRNTETEDPTLTTANTTNTGASTSSSGKEGSGKGASSEQEPKKMNVPEENEEQFAMLREPLLEM